MTTTIPTKMSLENVNSGYLSYMYMYFVFVLACSTCTMWREVYIWELNC